MKITFIGILVPRSAMWYWLTSGWVWYVPRWGRKHPVVCHCCPFLCGCGQKIRHKEEYGHILHGKDKMQILQIYFWRFFKISIWFSSTFIAVSTCAVPSWPALPCPGDIQRRVMFSAVTHPAKCRMHLARSQSCNISDNFLLPAKFIESISKLICQKHQHCSDNCFNFIWLLLAVHLLGWLTVASLSQSAWEKVQKSN